MAETASIPFTPISEDDLLAYSHLQALAQLQNEIRSLRSAIPALLTPLLRAPTTSSITPTSNPSTVAGAKASTDAATNKATEPQSEFREQAIKVQKDVKLLVNNLEKMCETLEAAEKVRSEDYNERGELIAQDPLLRTDVPKDLPLVDAPVSSTEPVVSDVNGEVGAQQKVSLDKSQTNGQSDVQPAIANAEYLFSGTEGLSVADGIGDANINLDVFDASLYNDFGLDNYSNEWAAFGTDDMLPPS